MTFLQVKNNASSTLAADITATDTSLTVATGEGAKFPDSNFHITIDDEILLCTTRTDDTFTVERAKEGTTAAAHSAGATVELRITAGIIQELQNRAHSSLQNLTADDHTQYLNTTRHDTTTRHPLGTVVPRDNFLGLTDTPTSYAGQAGKAPKVNAAENGLEFAPFPVQQWKVVSEVNITTNADYVDFTGLDINTDKVYLLFYTIKNPQGVSSIYRIFVEGDYTLTNYYSQSFYAAGTTLGGGRPNEPDFSVAPSGFSSFGSLFMFKDPDGYFQYYTSNAYGPPMGITIENRAGMKTATVLNITSIRVSSSAIGGIGAGSYFLLCKPRG